MNERIAVLAAIRNSISAIRGRILLSNPIIPPTKALMITSNVNCFQFSFSPNCTCFILRYFQLEINRVSGSYNLFYFLTPCFSQQVFWTENNGSYLSDNIAFNSSGLYDTAQRFAPASSSSDSLLENSPARFFSTIDK